MPSLVRKRIPITYTRCFLILILLARLQVGFGQDTIRYTGSPTFCAGKSLTLTTNPTGSTYQWQLNGNNVSTASFYTVSTAGTVTVTVNGVLYAPLVITVNPNPVADFTSTPNGQCGSVPINFNNTSTGNGLTYVWNFGDNNSGANNTSTLANPSHKFVGTPGNGNQNFNVTLTATSVDGCTTSIIKSVSIKQNPGIELGGDGYTIYADGSPYFTQCNSNASTFTFSNQSTTSSTNTSYTVIWGDNTPNFNATTFSTTTHIYNVGIYSLAFVVTGSNGCSDTGHYKVFVGGTPSVGFGIQANTDICTNSQLTFYVSNTENNPVGTYYVVSFSDTAGTFTYQNPAPDSINHTFPISSCGYTSPGSNGANSFYAKIVATNPCGVKEGNVLPIHVSQKPIAAIAISPSDTSCVGIPVTLKSSSPTINNVSTTGVCTVGKVVWQISPANGWAVSSGTLGNDFNSNSVSLWTAGSTSPTITFNTAGTYTIKLKIGGNTNCGIDSTTKTICVNPAPIGNFTLDNNIGCAPLNVATTNTSNTPNCGNNTYTWSVSYASFSGCLPNTIGYSYTNGTNSTSTNPQFQFNNPGTYTISLVTKSSNGACAAPAVIETVTVKAKPTVTINPVTAICQNNSINPTATVSNCAATTTPTYAWTFNNGTPSSATTLIPGSIFYTTIGSQTIRLDATNECGTTTDSIHFNVTNTPTANAGPDKSTCSGVPIQIGAAATGGFTYNWSPTTGLNNATAPNPTATLNYTGANPDTVYQYIIKTSAGATCFSYDTVLITVKAKPFVFITPTSTQICAGNSTTLTASGADSYVWSPTTGLSATNVAVVTATPTNNIIYTVTGTNAATGCTNTAQIALIVVAIVNPNAGPDTVVCKNTAAIQLTGTPGGGVWSGPFVSSSGVFNPQTAGNGVYTLYYTAGATGCSRTDSMVATVVDAALANAGNDTTVCASPTTFTLHGQPSGGTWSGSPFVTAAGVFNPSTAGTYQLYYSIGGGSCIGKDTIIVNVGSGVTNNIISPNQNVCNGAQPAIIVGQIASGGNGVATYQWQSSTDSTTWADIPGATGVSYTPPIILTTTFYRRIANTTLCAGAQGSISIPVKIKINPDAKSVFAPTVTTGCVPFKITPTIINLTPFPANNGQYNWYANGVSIGSGQTFPGYTMNNPGDSVTIKLVAVSLFGCKNDSMQVGFKTVVRPVPAFTQSDSVGCGPLRITFTNLTPSAANYTYLWDFGTGQTSTLLQPGVINFPKNPNYGDTVYTVKFKTFSQCDTITLTSFVRVRSTPKALFTPDKSVGCSPMTVTFTNTTRGAVTQPFVWDFGDGSAPLTSNAVTVQHTYNVGQRDTFKVKLVATNDCGSDTLVYALVVQPNTIRLDFAINGNNRYGCAPQTVAFINNTSGANAFTWNFGDGSSLLNTTKGVDTIYHTYNTIGNFTTTLKASNSCSDTSDVELVTIFARPKVSVSAFPLTACIGDSIRFTNQSDTGVSNLWKFGDGTTSFNRTPIKTYASAGSFGVNYTASYIYTNGTVCADSSLLNIIIRDTLQGTFTISDTAGACAPFAITVKYKGGNSLQTKWDFGDGTTAAFGDSLVHTFLKPGTYIVRMYVKENAGGCISTASKQVIVGGVTGSFTYQSGYFCMGSPVSLRAISTNATQYRYYFGDGDSLTTSITPVLHSYTRPGYYFPSVQLYSGTCALRITGTDTIKIDGAKPGFVTNAGTTCGATAIQFTDTSYSYFGIKSFVWDFGDGTATSQLQNPSHTYTTSGTFTIVLKTTGVSGCVNSVSIPLSVAVHSYPVSSIVGDSVACTNQPLALVASVQSIDNIQNLDWAFGNNATASGVNVKAIYALAGNYSVRLITRTVLGCADTTYKTVHVSTSPIVTAGADVTICKGQLAQIGAVGASSFVWYPSAGLSCTTCASPNASPTATTNYTVVGKNGAGCTAADSIIVNVVQPLKITVGPNDTICIGDHVQLTAGNASSYNWNPATGLSNSQIANPIASPTYTTQYRVIGTDANNCFTDTGYVVVAVGQYPVVDFGTNGGQVIAGTQIQFNPTITNGPIRYYRWTPTRDLSCTTCSNPVATINTDVTYILEATNIYGCAGSDTVSYKVNCDPSQVFIPTGFSPDGDGINDVLMVRAKGVAQVKYFRIFDRWGRLVFERNNIMANDPLQGWDGKEGGKDANIDVYTYTAEVICTAGGTFVYKGNVTLVR